MQIFLFLSLATTVMALAGQAIRQKDAGQYHGHIDFSISPFYFTLENLVVFQRTPI